jgi:hypothetical protein
MATVKRNDSEAVQLEKSDIQVIEDVKSMDGLDSIEDTKPGAFVWLCAAATAIGGMLFGCKDHVIPPIYPPTLLTLYHRRYRCHFRCSRRPRN